MLPISLVLISSSPTPGCDWSEPGHVITDLRSDWSRGVVGELPAAVLLLVLLLAERVSAVVSPDMQQHSRHRCFTVYNANF